MKKKPDPNMMRLRCAVLSEHLGETDIVTTDYEPCGLEGIASIEVSPYKKFASPSPADAMEMALRLHRAIAQHPRLQSDGLFNMIFRPFEYGLWRIRYASSDKIIAFGEKHRARLRAEFQSVFSKDAPHLMYYLLKQAFPPDATDMVNALYHILTGKPKDWHVHAYAAAFNLEKIDQSRRPHWHANSGEYLVLTDDEATEYARGYIKESVWAFMPEFLAQWISLPSDIIQTIQEKCEDANDPLLDLLGDDFGKFADAAISADGRGHFINMYDSTEDEFFVTSKMLEEIAKVTMAPPDAADFWDFKNTYMYIYRTN